MGRETVLFKSEERKSAEEVAVFLRQLADKLEEKRVVLRRGAEELSLDIPSSVILELKAEEEVKKGKAKRSLEVEIEWTVGGEAEQAVSLG